MRIDSSAGGLPGYLKEVYLFRELLWAFAAKDIKARFANTLLGTGWLILQPVLLVLIFTLIFSMGAGIDTGNVPYPVFIMGGILLWEYFSSVVYESGSSFLVDSGMVQKIYFPKILLPCSKSIARMVDLLFNLALLVVLSFVFGYWLKIKLFYAFLFIVLLYLLTIVASIWASILVSQYQDLKELIPFVLRVFFFLTPILYPMEMVPGQFHWIIKLNPMTGLINGFRWSVFGIGEFHFIELAPMLFVVVLLIWGLIYFSNREGKLADIV
ncbi:MAG: ABC transporter permease [Bacteroidota bacterium]